MARRKSIQSVARKFQNDVDAILNFLQAATHDLGTAHVSWAFEYAIIRLYRDFEDLILNSLKGAINNDPGTLSARTKIQFPNSLSDAVCEYLIVGTGYFDFKGRDGLIKTLKRFVPGDHYLINVIKQDKYTQSLERMCALRNYAAHDSQVSRNAAKEAVEQHRIVAAGAWLKSQNRFSNIAARLKELAADIEDEAPY